LWPFWTPFHFPAVRFTVWRSSTHTDGLSFARYTQHASLEISSSSGSYSIGKKKRREL
jgi:hypothetical protein